jgi:ribosomal-protein-alanine N-acetyltransferase
MNSLAETAECVRAMTLDDLEAVQTIDRLSFTLPWPVSAYRYELTENESSECYVAEHQGTVTGMVVVWYILDEAHIATIAVHPDWRGHLIGQTLLRTALQAAIRRGAALATLEVRSGNIVAQSLYTQFGFKVRGVRSKYYRDNNEDALIMTLEPLTASMTL